ncbi:MAG: imelysin family protein [Tenacibaculum sp.]
MRKSFKILLALFYLLLFAYCSDDSVNDTENEESELEKAKTEFIANYVNIVKASYDDALTKAKELADAVDAFVDNPDATTFDKVKETWLDSREPYGQTEAYRFYDGPIDGDGGEPEGYINAWPLDEGLIDYVESGTSGSNKNLVNDVNFTLSKENIKELSGEGGESNVTIGYHAIEFLLWGQDLTAPSEKKPGQRSFTDYTTAANAERRKQYLSLVAEILVEDLQSVVNQWGEDASYRKDFLASPKNDAIDKILTGAAKLSKGELAGERMTVAVENQDQEDEHSCFSDNTHRDIYLNNLAINNIIFGKYKKLDGTTISGTSLLDVLEIVDNDKATNLKTIADTAMEKVKVIEEAGFFDNQIIGETLDNTSKPVMSAVTSLREQGDILAEIGKSITDKNIDPEDI